MLKKTILLTCIVLLASSCSFVPDNNASTPPAIPATGTYIGGILLDGQTSIDDFNSSTGVKHAAFMEFVKFPDVVDTTNTEYTKLNAFITACKAANAIPTITLQTEGGLSSYTEIDIIAFAMMLYDFNTSIFLRWNHEMNGSWYAWGQQPTLYISKFREFADQIHTRAPNVAMVWTPNQGWGYPWAGGTYSIASTSTDFAILDTNHDGVLNDLDDPYTPYYPGDTYVDWVGHSYYHWSNISERGWNQVPYDGQWGQANGVNNDVINFHDTFAVGHDKPMMIAETSALYDPNNVKGGNASEEDIKKAWIKEVYNLSDDNNPKLNVSFPKIKAIFWFSQLKYEQEVLGDVDWRLNSNQQVIDYYQQVTADPYFVKAP
jgi:hypothetical protein